MKKLSRWIALSALSIAVIPFLSGCSGSTDHVKETTSTTTSYVQPAPAPMTVVTTPPSTINTTEEKSTSHSTDMGNNSTEQSTNAYHSESTTVTPAPTAVMPAPAAQTEQSTTYEKKTYKESTD
jgi:PBP1b-binding outer membrane lipoprotein LpoB